MRIAVGSSEDSLSGRIRNRLADSKVLLIIQMNDELSSAKIIKCIPNRSDTNLANITVENDCEAIISGVIETEAFNILAEKQITRYDGSGLIVFEGIQKMQAHSLVCFSESKDKRNKSKYTCNHE